MWIWKKNWLWSSDSPDNKQNMKYSSVFNQIYVNFNFKMQYPTQDENDTSTSLFNISVFLNDVKIKALKMKQYFNLV